MERAILRGAAESALDAHRPVGEALTLASIPQPRGNAPVTIDYTIAWNGQRWQIPKETIQAGLRGPKIRVEMRLDGKLIAWIGKRS